MSTTGAFHSRREIGSERALDEIWIEAARRLGVAVERGGDAYVHFDGARLHIADDEHLDEDDTVAQLVFHELCHALVQGPTLRHIPDWGLDNTTTRDAVREAAAVRLQAHLLGAFGLRGVLFPTTEVRAFYEALPDDAFAPAEDESARLAKVAAVEAARPPFRPVLLAALDETARACQIASHPRTGFALGSGAHTCGDCAWRSPGGLCRLAERRVRVQKSDPACARFEEALDCKSCGACCTSGFDAVPVGAREKISRRHPSLIVERDGFRALARAPDADDGRCIALAGPSGGPFSCMLYGDRPRACRELEQGGRHCLTARRRVGLTVALGT